jgi:hypothetical protein
MSKEYYEYVRLAQEGNLSADSSQWSLIDGDGWTVAHTAAAQGCLPIDFIQWDPTDDEFGWTVGHTAATDGHLPADFDQWGLADNDGLTILSQLLLFPHLDKHLSRWERERPLCRADADWDVFKKELPEIYTKYTVTGIMEVNNKCCSDAMCL